ncbi:MAG: DUF167 domain-containing protein [Candidatus Saccharimonadales bacterium]
MTNISVTVKSNSKKGDLIITNPDKSLTVFLRARPVDGAANSALIVLLSKHFHVPKTTIKVLKGHTSRQKLITIDD